MGLQRVGHDWATSLSLLWNTNLHFLLLFNFSVVRLFATPWTAACQASLSFTVSWNLLKLMSIEWMMLSNHFVLCRPHSLPALSLSQYQDLFQWVGSSPSGGQNIGASTLASVLPVSIQSISFRIDWFEFLPVQGILKSLLQHQFENINSWALSLLYGLTLTSIHGYWKNHSFDYMDLCRQGDISAF